MELMIVVLVAGVAVTLVVLPLVRRSAPGTLLETDSAIESAVAAYRTALRARTVCARCLRANPDNSRFCADCGRRLNHGNNAADAAVEVKTAASDTAVN